MQINRPSKGGILSRGRLALMGSAAVVAGAVFLAGPRGYLVHNGVPPIAMAQAADATGPASFADVVQRVSPAVISVRVKLKNEIRPSRNLDNDSENAGSQLPVPKGSPFE